MKSTGIVRRLDDLGRLVIPKEIRKQFRLKEGDSIEFFIDQERIIIQKYDLLSRHVEEIIIMCETLSEMYQNTVMFIQDEILSGSNFELSESFLKKSKVHRVTSFDNEKMFNDENNFYSGVIYPIIANGDWYGAFILQFDKSTVDINKLSALEGFSKVLSRQQEQ